MKLLPTFVRFGIRITIVFLAISLVNQPVRVVAQVSQALVNQAEAQLQKNPEKVLKELNLYLAEAERKDSIGLANYIAHSIGAHHLNTGNHQLAWPYLEKALAFAQLDSNAYQIAAAQDNLAIYHSRRGEAAKAIEYRKKSLDFYQKADSVWHEGLAQLWLGFAYKQAGDLNEAIRRYSSADSIGQLLNRIDLQIWAKGSLGTALRASGDPKGGLEALQGVKTLALQQGDSNSYLVSLQNIGNCYVSMNEHSKGLAYLDSAITLAGQRGDTSTIVLSQIAAITSLIRLDRIEEAQERIDKTMDMAIATGNKGAKAHLGAHQSTIHLYNDEKQKAYDLLKSTISLADSLGMKELLHEYYKELAAVSFVLGKVEEGYLYLGTYDSLKRENMLVDERSLKNLLDVKHRIDELQGHSDNLADAIETERNQKLGFGVVGGMSLLGLFTGGLLFVRYRRKRESERAALLERQQKINSEKEEIERSLRSEKAAAQELLDTQRRLREEKDSIEEALQREKETAQRLLDSTKQELEKLTADNDDLRTRINEYQNWLGVHGYVQLQGDDPKLVIDKLIETTDIRFTHADIQTIESLFSEPFLERKERAERLHISDSSMKDRLTKLIQALDVKSAPEIPIKVAHLILLQEIKLKNRYPKE